MAASRVDTAKAALRPRFDVNGTANQDQRYTQFNGSAYDFNQGRPAFYANANASGSIPLDISGVARRQVRQARLAEDLTKLDRTQVTIDVATDVRTQYVAALRAQEQVRADQQYVTMIESLLAKVRAEQPAVAHFLESERDNADQQLQSSRTSSELALSNLAQLLRLPNGSELVLTSSFTKPRPLPSTDFLLGLAHRHRVDLKQAQVRLDQARLSRKQAVDSRMPRLGMTGYAVQTLNGRTPLLDGSDSGRTLNTGVAMTFNLPLFQYDGGVLRNNRHIADVQAEQANADAAEAMERAQNEINQVLIGINRAQQRLQSLPDAEQARAALAGAEQQMIAATPGEAAGLLAQVTNARQNWRSATLANVDALGDYYGSFYRLQRAVGSEDILTE